MFRQCKTGCDGHVPVHGFCDTLHPQLHAHWFEAVHRNYRTWLYSVLAGLSVCISNVTMS